MVNMQGKIITEKPFGLIGLATPPPPPPSDNGSSLCAWSTVPYIIEGDNILYITLSEKILLLCIT